MKDIKIITVDSRRGFFLDKFENLEEIIEAMYKRGYSFKGYIPYEIGGYGILRSIKLVFEGEEY